MVIDRGSRKTVVASSNDTPCFWKFASSFESSHSNSKAMSHFSGVERWSSPAAAATSEGALLAASPAENMIAENPLWRKDCVEPNASSVTERDAVAVRCNDLFDSRDVNL